MTKVLLCRTANGEAIYYEDKTSHLATHLADTPQLYKLVQDYLSKQNFHEDDFQVEVDNGNVIGNIDLVETAKGDEIVYAKRLNRDTYTRFVKNKVAPPTSWFVIHIVKDSEGDYELASAWIGRDCPPFPDDPKATKDSKSYWETHALVFGNQDIQEDTLTTVAPW